MTILTIPFKGQEIDVLIKDSPFAHTRLTLRGKTLSVALASTARNNAKNEVANQILIWLKAQARRAFSESVEKQSKKYEFNYKSISIKDTKSRWGSCSIKQNLNFNWRLILAPEEILEYVVTHEITHLSQMNHSADFWAIVKNRCPEFNVYKKWLQANGAIIMNWKPEIKV